MRGRLGILDSLGRPKFCTLSPWAVRPKLVEGLPFDKLRANGTKWHAQTEQY